MASGNSAVCRRQRGATAAIPKKEPAARTETSRYEQENPSYRSVCLPATFAKCPNRAVRGVYARRKGPVKRKGVISRGCEANCQVSLWEIRHKSHSKCRNYNELNAESGMAAKIGAEPHISVTKALRPLPSCRNPVNSHVRAEDFREQDGAISLLIILHHGDPGAANGEAGAV